MVSKGNLTHIIKLIHAQESECLIDGINGCPLTFTEEFIVSPEKARWNLVY